MSMEFEFLFDLKLAHHQSVCSSPEPGCVHPDVQGRHEAEDVSGGGGLGEQVNMCLFVKYLIELNCI